MKPFDLPSPNKMYQKHFFLANIPYCFRHVRRSMPILRLKLEYVLNYKNVFVMDKQYMTYIDVNIFIPLPALQFGWVQHTSVLLV